MGNLQNIFWKPLFSEKVTVLLRIARIEIAEPYFFENHNGETVTVTKEHCTLMRRTAKEKIFKRNLLWFQ